VTSTFKSPRFLIASFNILTTSCPTTPSQLKDFVQDTRIPHSRLFWYIGKEKVKPRGNFRSRIPFASRNWWIQLARKSNKWSPGPSLKCSATWKYLTRGWGLLISHIVDLELWIFFSKVYFYLLVEPFFLFLISEEVLGSLFPLNLMLDIPLPLNSKE